MTGKTAETPKVSREETIAGLISSSSVCSERELAGEAYDAGYRAALSDALDKVEAMKTNFPTVAEIFAAEIRKLGQ